MVEFEPETKLEIVKTVFGKFLKKPKIMAYKGRWLEIETSRLLKTLNNCSLYFTIKLVRFSFLRNCTFKPELRRK